MTETFEAENRLSGSDSPYLLQHADNPVAWRPWGEAAFEEARRLDRPVFLSIGYSTCHWCHVMAHESFEDEEVAELLNERFVPIKVDREERPDVDQVYMTACQVMSGRGGWPLTVVTTPDREPFFAGTYFPKDDRGGRPGLMRILSRIAELWEEDRASALRSAGNAVDALERAMEAPGGEGLDEEALDGAYRDFARRFDASEAGFGSAPKFPSPHDLMFLFRHAHRTGEERASEMAAATLRAMRRGGIWDHVGFGFHRYSTDARWLLPHFEKMLYDQAMLALAYTEGWQVTGEDLFARTVRQIVTYLRRDLRDEAGAFHAAEDADSEGGEGAFYVWEEDELRELLDEEDFELAADVWNTRAGGNFAEESTGRKTGENVLHRRRSLEEIAADRGLEAGELRDRLERIRRTLFEAREGRPRPHRDDKVLADWNGLAVAALARAGSALEEEGWVETAREAAGFVLEEMRDGEGRLLHRWRGGRAGVEAGAADYACLVWGLIELYEATHETRWLREALTLQEEMEGQCGAEGGGWYSGPHDRADELPVRAREGHDGAIPSANSVGAWNALRLARLTGRTELEDRGLAAERAWSDRARRSPGGHAMLLVAVDFRVGPTREVVLAGEEGEPELAAMRRVLRGAFRPRTVHVHRPSGDLGEAVDDLSPLAAEHAAGEGGTAAWVCTDFACRAPVGTADELREELEG
mgnify:CR=1 FL=1